MFFNVVQDEIVEDLLHLVVVASKNSQNVTKHIPCMVDSFVDSLLALNLALIFEPRFSDGVVNKDVIVRPS